MDVCLTAPVPRYWLDTALKTSWIMSYFYMYVCGRVQKLQQYETSILIPILCKEFFKLNFTDSKPLMINFCKLLIAKLPAARKSI